jgi:hypothetical protein
VFSLLDLLSLKNSKESPIKIIGKNIKKKRKEIVFLKKIVFGEVIAFKNIGINFY